MPSRKVKIFTVPGRDHPLTIERNAFRAVVKVVGQGDYRDPF
jgi:hypothetical protein